MSQPQHTYTLRQEVGFGIELALSQLGEPHEIQIENFKGNVFAVRITDDPLASLRAASLWTSFSVNAGQLTTVPAGTRKLAVENVQVGGGPTTVFHVPGFFRGAENARYYGVDQLDSPSTAPAPAPPGNVQPAFWFDFTNIDQLFQDTGRTVPVTAAGQSILGAKDLGSSVADITGLNGPTFRTGGLNGLSFAEFVVADSDCLRRATGGVTIDAGSRTIMCVYKFANSAGTGQRFVMANTSGGSALYSHNANDFDPTYTPQTRINGATGNGNAIADQTIVAAIGEMIQSGGTDPFEYRFHYQAAHVTGNNTLTSATLQGLNVGCDGVGALFFEGDIYETAAWVNGTIPTLDDLEAYITDKYGLAWA